MTLSNARANKSGCSFLSILTSETTNPSINTPFTSPACYELIPDRQTGGIYWQQVKCLGYTAIIKASVRSSVASVSAFNHRWKKHTSSRAWVLDIQFKLSTYISYPSGRHSECQSHIQRASQNPPDPQKPSGTEKLTKHWNLKSDQTFLQTPGDPLDQDWALGADGQQTAPSLYRAPHLAPAKLNKVTSQSLIILPKRNKLCICGRKGKKQTNQAAQMGWAENSTAWLRRNHKWFKRPISWLRAQVQLQPGHFFDLWVLASLTLTFHYVQCKTE